MPLGAELTHEGGVDACAAPLRWDYILISNHQLIYLAGRFDAEAIREYVRLAGEVILEKVGEPKRSKTAARRT